MPASALQTLKMQDAATLLNVSPSTLRSWERRFGYPAPLRSAGGHRMYPHGEIVALRDALEGGLPIASAVSSARETLGAGPGSLARALGALDFVRADEAMEAALTLGTVERAVEELMLTAFRELGERVRPGGAPWSLAARWAVDWLRRAQRLSPSPAGVASVLIGDATGAGEIDEIALRALELICMRGGADVMTVPVTAVADLSDVVHPGAVDVAVLAGGQTDKASTIWTHAARRLVGRRPFALYRHRGRQPDRALAGAETLSETPTRAAARLIARLSYAGPG